MSSATMPIGARGRPPDPETLGDPSDRLYRAARGLCGSCEEAENLVRETFARVRRKPGMLRSEDDIGYLLRARRKTFILTQCATPRRSRTVPPPDTLELFEYSHSALPEALLEASALDAANSALPSALRDAVIAIDLVELSYREAAGTVRVRQAPVTTWLDRGRQRIAGALAVPSSAPGAANHRGDAA